MDDIERNVKLLREWMQSVENVTSAKRCHGLCGSNAPPASSYTIIDSSVNKLNDGEVEEFRQKVSEKSKELSQLTAHCASLESQLSSKSLECEALTCTNRTLQSEVTLLRRSLENLQAQKKETKESILQAQKAQLNREARLAGLQKDFNLLQNDYSVVCEKQLDSLQFASVELQLLVESLSKENLELKVALREKKELEKKLDDEKKEKETWKLKASQLKDEITMWESEWEEVKEYSAQSKIIVEKLQALLASRLREEKILRETITTQQQLLDKWEITLSTSEIFPPLDHFTCSKCSNKTQKADSLSQQEVPQLSLATNCPENSIPLTSILRDSNDNRLLQLLEAKTVDLALALHGVTAESHMKSVQYNLLVSERLKSIGETFASEELRRTFQPMLEALTEKNEAHEAELAVSEQVAKSLLESYRELLEEYTQEVYHNVRLEAALAERVFAPISAQGSSDLSNKQKSLSTATIGASKQPFNQKRKR